MLTKNVIAIDLAKNVLQACHISIHGELLSNKPLSRQKMKEFQAKAKPSIVAMEGCCGCHYWGQLAEKFGHEVRIITMVCEPPFLRYGINHLNQKCPKFLSQRLRTLFSYHQLA